MSTFSERLRIALDERDVSQHALARLTGLSQGEVNNMARGRRGERVQFSMVMKLARALRIDPNWLGEGSGAPPSAEEAIDVLPKRRLAIQLWREARREERAVERLMSDPLPAHADELSTLGWIEQLQYAERLPPATAPASPVVARSHARPRADIAPPTRRSSPQKK